MTYPHTIHDEIEYETSLSAYLANQVRLLRREVRKLNDMMRAARDAYVSCVEARATPKLTGPAETDRSTGRRDLLAVHQRRAAASTAQALAKVRARERRGGL